MSKYRIQIDLGGQDIFDLSMNMGSDVIDIIVADILYTLQQAMTPEESPPITAKVNKPE